MSGHVLVFLWQQKIHIPPMPTPRVPASAVGYGQQLIVAGGESSVHGNAINTVVVYSGQQWVEADPLPCGYRLMKSTVLNGSWYLTVIRYHSMGPIAGGAGNNSILSVNLQLLTDRAASPQRDGPSPWKKLPDAPYKLMAVASTEGGLFCLPLEEFLSP